LLNFVPQATSSSSPSWPCRLLYVALATCSVTFQATNEFFLCDAPPPQASEPDEYEANDQYAVVWHGFAGKHMRRGARLHGSFTRSLTTCGSDCHRPTRELEGRPAVARAAAHQAGAAAAAGAEVGCEGIWNTSQMHYCFLFCFFLLFFRQRLTERGTMQRGECVIAEGAARPKGVVVAARWGWRRGCARTGACCTADPNSAAVDPE